MKLKEVLNNLKWNPSKSLEGATITYIHRGAPNNRKTMNASSIIRFESGCMVTSQDFEEVSIPLHRIITIDQGGEQLWKRTVK